MVFDFVWFGVFPVVFVAHGAREARRGICDSVWMVLDFWFGLGLLSAFVGREARRGVWDSGFGWKMDPSPGPGPFIHNDTLTHEE